MRRNFFAAARMVLLLVLLSIAGCAGNSRSENIDIEDTSGTIAAPRSNDSLPAGKITTIVCRNDASQTYALYIPANGMDETSAIIFFFDPHADGALPLKKYQHLADRYNFILAGSNNSKNGNDWSTTDNMWSNLFEDAQQRLTFDRHRIYACGFSGGAKVAGYIALRNPEIKAVIANGSGLPDGTSPGNFNFSFTAIAGEGDMNMTDLVSTTNDLDKTQTRHRIIFFKGKHEWAPEATMNLACEGLQLDAMRDKIIAKDDAFISDYVSASKKGVDESAKANDLLGAVQVCKLSISMLSNLTDETSWFSEKEASVKKTAAYQLQLSANEKLFNIEQSKKTEYSQAFQQGDLNYWARTIADLQSKSKPQTDEGAMYQRLLAYLSLAFYSITNQLINANQNKEAEYFVELYKKADPTNSEAWYFSAILDARNGSAVSTEADLLKAAENGFRDKDRMLRQSEFIKLSNQINLTAVESKMKSGD